jgi:hypothetical protein
MNRAEVRGAQLCKSSKAGAALSLMMPAKPGQPPHPFYYVGTILGAAALPVAAIPGTAGLVGGSLIGGGAIISGTIDKTLY